MRLTLSRLLLLAMIAAIAVSWNPARRFFAADKCLDAGGSYDYGAARCDFDRSQPGPAASGVEQPTVSVSAVAVAALAVGVAAAGFTWRDRRHSSRPVV